MLVLMVENRIFAEEIEVISVWGVCEETLGQSRRRSAKNVGY